MTGIWHDLIIYLILAYCNLCYLMLPEVTYIKPEPRFAGLWYNNNEQPTRITNHNVISGIKNNIKASM